MNHEQKQIHNWQEQLRSRFDDTSRLFEYLFETMDNFYHRYLETSIHKELKTQELAPHCYGATSFETDMAVALKVTSPEARRIIMELAKAVPKSQGPKVLYTLSAQIVELTPDRGEILITAEVEALETIKKQVRFKYQELAQFRKEFALRLEEVCEVFL